MSKLFVTYEKRSCNSSLLPDTCKVFEHYNVVVQNRKSNDYNRMYDVLHSLARVEYNIWDGSKRPIGSFILTVQEDMHYGKVCVVAAHYMTKRSREANKLFMWYLKRFCDSYGCKYYQRSCHVSPNRQVMITKEV